MKGAIAVFVKTPGLSPVKTRLAEAIGKIQAERFHELACGAMRSLLKTVQSQMTDELDIFWAVAENEGIHNPMWADFERIFQGSGGLGERLSKVYDELIQKYSYVVFMGADSPQVSPRQIQDGIVALTSGAKFVIGPAEDGGFYFFGGTQKIDRRIWLETPYSDWETGEILAEKLSAIGPVKKIASQFDIDTIEELRRLKKLLGSKTDLLTEQSKLLSWMSETGI